MFNAGRVVVRSEIRRIGSQDFFFQAAVKDTGGIINCSRAPNFYGEVPDLKIGDEIEVHTIGEAIEATPVPVWHIERPGE